MSSQAMTTASETVQPNRAGLSPRTMYFPPPPAYAVNPPSKKNASIPFTFAFKSQSQPPLRPSTSSSTSSTINSITLQKPPAPRPILKRSISSTKRTRQWILLSLLLLSFTILILSTIFAYCAALPHSDNIADAQASEAAVAQGFDGPVTTTVSVSLVAATTATAAPTSNTGGSEQPQGDSYPTRRSLTLKSRRNQLLKLPRDTPSITVPNNEMSQEDIDAALARDAQNQSRFSSTHAQVALTFYTATLPVLTMMHTAFELLFSLVHPETSQNTKFGDLVLLRNRVRGGASDAELALRRRRVGALVSFSVSTLLLLGWSVMQLFTLNCEIITFGNGGEEVCPVQIRGHRMGGISELSVGKVCLGFAVVLGYAVYCWYLVSKVGICKGLQGGGDGGNGSGRRIGSFKRRARFALGEGGKGDRLGDVESVSVVGVETGGGRGSTV